ncbi:MAG: hypothetical protein IPK19_06770 [Chloroflexi bacterium]|nr:hypothetical protein [Chloroflexota bacterium]
MKRLGTLLLLIVVLGALVGIVSAQDTPVEGGVLRVSVSANTGLDPIFISDDMSMYPSSLVYQFLVRAIRQPDGAIAYKGDLAESAGHLGRWHRDHFLSAPGDDFPGRQRRVP